MNNEYIYKYIYERRALLYKWFYGKCTYHPAICSWRQANKKYIGLGFQKIIINKTLSHKAHKRFLWAGYAQFTRVPLKALSDQVLIKLLTILKFNFFNCGFTLQIGLAGKHYSNQGNKARKFNCCCVFSAYILKPVLSGSSGRCL